MSEATITFEPARLQKAMEDEMGEHWRHLASGQCQCGRSRSKDPSVWRQHMAEELLAVVLRFQQPDPVLRRPDGSSLSGPCTNPECAWCRPDGVRSAFYPKPDHSQQIGTP